MVLLAKVEHAVELEIYGSAVGDLPVVALIETPAAVESAVDGLRRHCERLRQMGFTGMWTVTADHVSVVAEVLGAD